MNRSLARRSMFKLTTWKLAKFPCRRRSHMKKSELLTITQIEYLVRRLERGHTLPKRREDIPDAHSGALFSKEEIIEMLESNNAQ